MSSYRRRSRRKSRRKSRRRGHAGKIPGPGPSKMILRTVNYKKKVDYTCKDLNCQKKLVYDILKDFDFPTTERNNVLRTGQTGYEGFVLGVVNTRGLVGVGKMLSRKTQSPKYRELYLNTKKLMDMYIKKHDRKFKFTSIQFNKSHRAAYHVDAKNVGESYIIGVGDYKGGELIVYDRHGKNPKKKNIKNRFFKFNGSIYPHETAEFTGNRFTMVFYNV